MYIWGVVGSHHWVLVSVPHNCNWKGKGEHNTSVTLCAKTYICNFPSGGYLQKLPMSRLEWKLRNYSIFLALDACDFQTGNTEILSVSFLQIFAVFLAITAATGSLLGHHGKRWVRPLYAPGRPLWFVPEELSYCDTKLCRYFWRKKFYQSVVWMELLSGTYLKCESLQGLRSQVWIQYLEWEMPDSFYWLKINIEHNVFSLETSWQLRK